VTERERPNEDAVRKTLREIPDPETAQPDAAEPAGEQDPAVEKEYDDAKEEAAGEAASSEPDPAAEAARYLDLAQRTQAEFENYRKRAARDAAQAGERAKANLVRELLPVVDNLAEGVRLVHTELVNTLERNGIKAFDPAGEQFDPSVHEALSTRPGDNGAGVVLDVVEKGYKLGDAVIRPARVIVSA
jgi:molecular chaperone GrpE